MSNIGISKWGRWRIADVSIHNLKEVSELLYNSKINAVCVSPFRGFEGRLEILNSLPYYEGIIVEDCYKFDCSTIPRLSEMKFLCIGNERTQAVDFSAITGLEYLRGHWHPKDIFPGSNSPLQHLALWGYKPKSRDLSEFPAYEHLEELSLYQSRIETLEGVQRFIKLREFEAGYCRALTSVAALVDSPVETVGLEACGQIGDIPALKKCSQLKKLRASKCGSLKSLKFLNESNSIDWFSFVGTDVEDGDMTPLFKLSYAGFLNKHHFSHTFEQVKEISAKSLPVADSKADREL